jgi:hypothetical protein
MRQPCAYINVELPIPVRLAGFQPRWMGIYIPSPSSNQGTTPKFQILGLMAEVMGGVVWAAESWKIIPSAKGPVWC